MVIRHKIPQSDPPPDACVLLTPKRDANCSKVKIKFTRLKGGSGEYILNTDVSIRAVLGGIACIPFRKRDLLS